MEIGILRIAHIYFFSRYSVANHARTLSTELIYCTRAGIMFSCHNLLNVLCLLQEEKSKNMNALLVEREMYQQTGLRLYFGQWPKTGVPGIFLAKNGCT